MSAIFTFLPFCEAEGVLPMGTTFVLVGCGNGSMYMTFTLFLR
ncbi:MAG TPA: hypothetical protein VMS96_10310 [Terriglobales bacterium]|nr:hypothetical protein [Terriglobales bacterium]